MLEEQIIILLVIAAVVAILAQRFKLPYTVALVVSGLALGLVHMETGLHLTQELVFAVFLPALLFEAAFHLDAHHFRRDAGPILILAILGVVISLFITGGLTYQGLILAGRGGEMSLLFALLFGALISATDPISVLAIFKELGLPHRLNLIVEGESLLNDGTAVVIFSLLLSAVSSQAGHGGELGPLWVGGMFIKEVFGGVAVGLVLGLALSYITAQVEDHLIEIMLTTILAYGSYLIAAHLHVSGVIAVVAAGMMSGNYGSRVGMSPTTKIAVVTFWEYGAFAVNSLIFLLIGLEVEVHTLWHYKFHILIGWLAVLLGRAAAINLLLPVSNRLFRRVPWRWSPILIWGGLRGSLSMALVLSLKSVIEPQIWEMLASMTFGVVVLSILGQGLTIKPFLKLLDMIPPPGRAEYEELTARIKADHAALSELKAMYESRSISRAVFERIRAELEERLEGHEREALSLHEADQKLHVREYQSARRRLLAVRKDSARESYRLGSITESTLKLLVAEIDRELSRLSAGDEPESEESEEE